MRLPGDVERLRAAIPAKSGPPTRSGSGVHAAAVRAAGCSRLNRDLDYAYVDTSAWVSLADASEVSHERVAAALRERQGRLVTGDHVLQEAWTVMRHRHSHREAETLVNAIRSGIARIEVSGLADLEVAAAIGAAFADQDFALSDRTSWAVMERLGIHDAVSLDNDFRIYRFGPGRRRAFTVTP